MSMRKLRNSFGSRKKLEQEREEKQRLEQQNESLQAALRRQERQRDKEKEEEAQKLVDQQKQLANQRNQLANQQSQLAKERRDRALQEAKVREANRQEQMRIEQEKRDQIWKRQEKLRKLKTISPDSLYALRELIRKRYELDVKIWNLKGVKKADRGIVENMMEKADAVMMEITNMVQAWEGTESSWTKREWGQAMEIQKRILSDGKRSWLGNPPWDDQEEEDSDEWEF